MLEDKKRIDVHDIIPEMTDIVSRMLKNSLDALFNKDVDLAIKVQKTDDDVDILHSKMFSYISERIKIDNDLFDSLYANVISIKMFRKNSKHCTNIAEDVEYFISGEITRHHHNNFFYLLEINIMNHYKNYLEEINKRKENGLNPKPIDNGELLSEIIDQIVDLNHIDRKDSLNFFIYNVIPGTTSAARVKAAFLKQIIVGDINLKEISPDFAFELLSHMKGGPSIEVLIDFISGNNLPNARNATNVLKNQVFLYEADMDRLADLFNKGNDFAKEILESYSKAEFFTKLPEVQEEIKVVTYVAGIGDISTDFLSPGGDAHSRSDRELHGQSIFDHDKNLQKELLNLKELHPDKTVMLIAEKGTMGVGSSRMSGVNNVALWTGQKTSPYVPFVNNAPIVAGTNGISPIFLTTVDVTGGIGINLQNWIKKKGF